MTPSPLPPRYLSVPRQACAILALVSAALWLAACGQSSSKNKDPATTPTVRPENGDSVPASGSASSTPGDPVASLDSERYQADLVTIAKPRPPGSAHWQTVQTLCADRLSQHGYQVERQRYGTGVNVIGTRLGSKAPEDLVILSAHYDSTDATCPGADDNATGVAGLLESARVLAQIEHERTLVAICWDEEERGLIGSQAYAKAAREAGHKVIMMYDYEMIGYSDTKPGSQKLPTGFELLYPEEIKRLKDRDTRGDFIALVFDDHDNARAAAASLERTASSLELPAVALAVPSAIKNSAMAISLRRSDHASFWLHDFPAMMLTDTANFRNHHYHCRHGVDSIDDLDHDFTLKVMKATVTSALAMLRAP